MSCTLRAADPNEELHRAEQVLMWAYDRARRIGYRPGSDEMLALRRAEQAHQQARARDLRRCTERLRSDAETPTRTGRVVYLTDRRPTHDSPPGQGPSGRAHY